MRPIRAATPCTLTPQVRPYAALRDDLRSGDILLASGTAFFSRLIQHRTNSLYSHVGLVWRNEEADRVMIYESIESKGVINAPFSRYLGNYKGTGRPYPGRLFFARHSGFATLTTLQRQTFLQFAIDVQQYEYDSHEIARIAVALAAPELAWAADLPEVTLGKRYICSVYAGEAFQMVGLTIPQDTRGFLAPADFPRAPEVTVLWEVEMPQA